MKLNIGKRKRTFNLIATSDIAFLLLIFLVVTSSLEYSQDISPPKTDYVENLQKGAESIPIEVNEQGEYSLLGFRFALQDLPRILSGVSHSAIIKIFADENADFSYITQLVDALQLDKRQHAFLMMEKKE